MEQRDLPLTKAQKRKLRAGQKPQSTPFKMKRVTSQTKNQAKFFENYDRDNHQVFLLSGASGTGKSYIALFKALEELADSETYKKVKIIRSNVSVRDMGFLPGSSKEKMEAYETPYVSIVSDLYERGDAYTILKNKAQLEFHPTSHLRGLTFTDCIVIVDECQNMSFQELDTIVTRVGTNCRLILCGDIHQDDLTSERYKEVSGFDKIKKILNRIDSVFTVEFTVDDIVRSGFVRDYLLIKNSKPVKAVEKLVPIS